MPIADKSNQKFERLLVIKQVGWYEFPSSSKREALWLCLCDCGNKAKIRGSALASGRTKSCGCLKTDKLTKHGMYKTSEYTAYQHMIDRCTNSKASKYKDYGGRGIKVCKSWLGKEGFKNFIRDMGKKRALVAFSPDDDADKIIKALERLGYEVERDKNNAYSIQISWQYANESKG